MIVTQLTKDCLASRRETRRLEALGYRKHETDWEIHRGFLCTERIIDVKISVCGKYVWTKLSKAP
jgi:hypothetical protein